MYNKEFISDIYPEYFLIKINNFDNLAKNTLDEWVYFLKNGEIKQEFKAKGLLKAKEIFDVMNLSEAERQSYRRYQDNLHYQASMVDSSYGEGKAEGIAVGFEKGIEQGIEKGMEQGIERGKATRERQIASNMLKDNLPIEKISKLTGLSIEVIKEIEIKSDI
jgi:predicted transposase/invertase (TIGR01784 family)